MPEYPQLQIFLGWIDRPGISTISYVQRWFFYENTAFSKIELEVAGHGSIRVCVLLSTL